MVAPAAAEGQAGRPVERERLVAADPAVSPGTAPVVRVASIARGSPSTATAAPFRSDWSASFPGRLRSDASACQPMVARNGNATTALPARINPPDLPAPVRRRRSRQSPTSVAASIRRRRSAPARPPTEAPPGVATTPPVRRRRRPARVPPRPRRGSIASTRGLRSRVTVETQTVALLAGAATERRRPTVPAAGRAAASTARPSSPAPSVPTLPGTSRAGPVPAGAA